jgi:hypothetical protein
MCLFPGVTAGVPGLLHPAAAGCCAGVLRSAASASGLLRCSMQHCCVQLVANAEEFSSIDAVLSIEGDPPCLHGPLDSRTGDITGTGSFREGELGHGRSLCGAWVSDSLAMIRQARGRKQGAASDNRLYVNERHLPRMDRILCIGPIPTVCPSNDSASMLSYQELPTSIQLWRGHG